MHFESNFHSSFWRSEPINLGCVILSLCILMTMARPKVNCIAVTLTNDCHWCHRDRKPAALGGSKPAQCRTRPHVDSIAATSFVYNRMAWFSTNEMPRLLLSKVPMVAWQYCWRPTASNTDDVIPTGRHCLDDWRDLDSGSCIAPESAAASSVCRTA